ETKHHNTNDPDQANATDIAPRAEIRIHAVNRRLHEHDEQDYAAKARENDLRKQRANSLLRSGFTEVPGTRESGDPVVEANHHAERGDGVPKDVFAEETHNCVKNGGDDR